jgi:hypothetical protein
MHVSVSGAKTTWFPLLANCAHQSVSCMQVVHNMYLMLQVSSLTVTYYKLGLFLHAVFLNIFDGFCIWYIARYVNIHPVSAR